MDALTAVVTGGTRGIGLGLSDKAGMLGLTRYGARGRLNPRPWWAASAVSMMW